MALRPELERCVQALLARGEQTLSLDVISEAIGTLPVSYEEIDAMFAALEARGCSVGDPDRAAASHHLGPVLKAARELRDSHGRSPTVEEIAERSGLEPDEVRLALLFARTLGR